MKPKHQQQFLILTHLAWGICKVKIKNQQQSDTVIPSLLKLPPYQVMHCTLDQ